MSDEARDISCSIMRLSRCICFCQIRLATTVYYYILRCINASLVQNFKRPLNFTFHSNSLVLLNDYYNPKDLSDDIFVGNFKGRFKYRPQ